MYIDARKFNYDKLDEQLKEVYTKRDKEHAKSAYRKWMEERIDEIVERQWEIDDIGVVEKVGEFVKLLREAEFNYSVGAYTSAIALICICTEDICKLLANSAKLNLDKIGTWERIIDTLYSHKIFDKTTTLSFHSIRKLRNDCLHYNDRFKSKPPNEVKKDALEAINTFKREYARIMGVIDYDTVDFSKFAAMVNTISSITSDSENIVVGGVGGSKAQLRNLFAEVFGVDLSLDNGGKPTYISSIYKVVEIDKDIPPPEITLFDLVSKLPVVVDLTKNELIMLNDKQIIAGDTIKATLMTVTNSLGMSEIWRLWGETEKVG